MNFDIFGVARNNRKIRHVIHTDNDPVVFDYTDNTRSPGERIYAYLENTTKEIFNLEVFLELLAQSIINREYNYQGAFKEGGRTVMLSALVHGHVLAVRCLLEKCDYIYMSFGQRDSKSRTILEYLYLLDDAETILLLRDQFEEAIDLGYEIHGGLERTIYNFHDMPGRVNHQHIYFELMNFFLSLKPDFGLVVLSIPNPENLLNMIADAYKRLVGLLPKCQTILTLEDGDDIAILRELFCQLWECHLPVPETERSRTVVHDCIKGNLRSLLIALLDSLSVESRFINYPNISFARSRLLICPSNEGVSPLMMSCKASYASRRQIFVNIILEYNERFNRPYSLVERNTELSKSLAFIVSASNQNYDEVLDTYIAERLIQYGADINYKDSSRGSTAVQLVLENGRHGVLKVLLKLQMLDLTTVVEGTPWPLFLHTFVSHFTVRGVNRKQIVKEQIKIFLEVRPKIESFQAVYYIGLAQGLHKTEGIKLLKFIVDNGADVRGSERCHMTCLMAEISHQELAAVNLLLDGGSDLRFKFRQTPCKANPPHRWVNYRSIIDYDSIVGTLGVPVIYLCHSCFKQIDPSAAFIGCTSRKCNCRICHVCFFLSMRNTRDRGVLTPLGISERKPNPVICNLIKNATKTLDSHGSTTFSSNILEILGNANLVEPALRGILSSQPKQFRKLGILDMPEQDNLLVNMHKINHTSRKA